MKTFYLKYVLVEDIHKMKAEGWELADKKECKNIMCNTIQTRVVLRLGGDDYKSVLMRKEDD